MAVLNKYELAGRKWPENDCLFFKFQGHSQAALQETAKVVKRIVEKHGGKDFKLAQNEEDAEALWTARKNALGAGLAFVPGAKGIPTDVW
jgi:D-lactate dehydrogenase (cytochrome)